MIHLNEKKTDVTIATSVLGLGYYKNSEQSVRESNPCFRRERAAS